MTCDTCKQALGRLADPPPAPAIDGPALEPAVKPAPLRVGVTGINAVQFGAAPERPKRPPIDFIVRLPPFEMFAAEKLGVPGNAVAQRAVRNLAAEPSVLDEYETWHAAKGRWPAETPYGVLRGGG